MIKVFVSCAVLLVCLVSWGGKHSEFAKSAETDFGPTEARKFGCVVTNWSPEAATGEVEIYTNPPTGVVYVQKALVTSNFLVRTSLDGRHQDWIHSTTNLCAITKTFVRTGTNEVVRSQVTIIPN